MHFLLFGYSKLSYFSLELRILIVKMIQTFSEITIFVQFFNLKKALFIPINNASENSILAF